MSLTRLYVSVWVLLICFAVSLSAQQAAPAAAGVVVPPLVNFSGVLTDVNGKPLTGITGVTFSLYAEQNGGAPLWLETQNVQPDKNGNYTAQLGSTTSQGLPSSLFVSGQARWLEVQPQGQEPQPRVMLLSVPYALKAGDAQTLNGQPASAFLTASSGNAAGANGVSNNAITGGGTTDYVPLWLSKSKLGSSKLFQSTGGDLGIGTTSPAANLDVNGTSDIRNTLTLFPNGSAPTLSVGGTAFEVSNKGVVTFVSGQTFPGTATLGANSFTGNQTVSGNVSATGVVTGSSYQIGSNLFAFGSYANQNAFLGFAGNTTTTGGGNTAIGYQALLSNTNGGGNNATGYQALYSNTTGTYNVADGFAALIGNTTGSGNTADGAQALQNNTTAYNNTAVGNAALYSNTTGSNNTASGVYALYSNTTANYNTASGYYALVSNTTGSPNDAFGYEALYFNTTGNSNDAFGYQALLSNTTGGDNAAFGYQALFSNSTGYQNEAFGYQALYSNTTSCCNDAFGYQALYSSTTGEGNDAFGYAALYSNTTGYENTAVGDQALYSNTTGNDLTCIGYDCSAGEDGLSNATAIGAHAVVGQSNSLVLGGTGQYAVKVGIGTTTPSNILTIGRGAGHPVSDSWETYSSRRWKTNIQTLPDALAKVEQLRGVSYDLKDSGKHEIGVIAEEVGAVVPEVVTYEDNGKDARGVDYSRLTALLIEATKEQQREITALRRQLQRRAAKEVALESRLKQLEQHRGEAQLASAHPVH
jgi:hypothetical protein